MRDSEGSYYDDDDYYYDQDIFLDRLVDRYDFPAPANVVWFLAADIEEDPIDVAIRNVKNALLALSVVYKVAAKIELDSNEFDGAKFYINQADDNLQLSHQFDKAF